MQSGGVKRIIVSCVDLARTPLSFSFSLNSKPDTGDKLSLLSSIPTNNPLPRTSFTWFGFCCWILCRWRRSSSPILVDLFNNKTSISNFTILGISIQVCIITSICWEYKISQCNWYLSASFSSLITSSEAMATALANGFPPKVLWTTT